MAASLARREIYVSAYVDAESMPRVDRNLDIRTWHMHLLRLIEHDSCRGYVRT